MSDNPAHQFRTGGAPQEARSGVSATTDFTKSAYGHPIVRWRDLELTLDVYQYPNAPMEVHLYCPVCASRGDRHMLRVRQDRKRIEYHKTSNTISIERFRCTWEPDNQSARFGINRCTWSVAIDNNIARDV